MDTTLRDGEQTNNVSFSPREKLHIARILLEKVNVDRIEVASALVSEGERQSTEKIMEWATGDGYLDRIEILGYVDTHRSVDWIVSCQARCINLLTKGSLHHLTKQLKKEPARHFKDIAKTVEYAQKKSVAVNVYLEDFSNGFRNSPEYVFEMVGHLKKLGVKRVMLPDTLGVMYPTEVYDVISLMNEKFEGVHFDFHPHNDYGLGTVNTLEAVRAGAGGVHVTVNCLGERTGNASLAEVSASLSDHLENEVRHQIKEKNILSVTRLVESFSGKRLASNAPIVGEDVFTQTAGIHADGDSKGGLYESRLMPQRFGRKRIYALGKMSGKASVDQNLKELGIELTEENRNKVLERIKQLGDKKKIVTPEDLPFIISDVLELPELNKVRFDNVVITSGLHIMPMCSLTISYKEKQQKVTGTGDGGYDAFMSALRSWGENNGVKVPVLLDYEVRIPPGGKTSALVECKITWDTGEKNLATRGVEPDQALAAIQATLKMLNLIVD